MKYGLLRRIQVRRRTIVRQNVGGESCADSDSPPGVARAQRPPVRGRLRGARRGAGRSPVGKMKLELDGSVIVAADSGRGKTPMLNTMREENFYANSV